MLLARKRTGLHQFALAADGTYLIATHFSSATPTGFFPPLQSIQTSLTMQTPPFEGIREELRVDFTKHVNRVLPTCRFWSYKSGKNKLRAYELYQNIISKD